MWRAVFVFLVVMPAAALTAGLLVLRAWRRNPLGRASHFEAERRETARVQRAISSLGERTEKPAGKTTDPREERPGPPPRPD